MSGPRWAALLAAAALLRAAGAADAAGAAAPGAIPANAKVRDLDLDALRRAMAGRTGDAAQGRWLFGAQRCAQCHLLEEGRAGIGPNLGRIGQARTRSDLVEDIVVPEAATAFGYDLRRFSLADGSTVTGSVMESAPRRLQVVEPAGRIRAVDPDAIVEESTVPGSAMPRALVANLTLDQFAHLLAFLESLGGGTQAPEPEPAEREP